MSGAAEADLELGIRVNIDATRQVFDTLRRVNPGVKVIFASTTAVYGPPPSPGFPLAEANAPQPGSSYGAQNIPAGSYGGGSRVVNLPGVTVSIPEMLAALKAVGGQEALDLVEEKRDAVTERIVETWPAKYDTARAKQLGFTDDGTLEQTLKEYIEDYGSKKS
ncbi:MAG: hypothetical protein Q9184_000110 [Pyrenodesmia sp. 2 TL-2023]